MIENCSQVAAFAELELLDGTPEMSFNMPKTALDAHAQMVTDGVRLFPVSTAARYVR
jgi:hypothetical protein